MTRRATALGIAGGLAILLAALLLRGAGIETLAFTAAGKTTPSDACGPLHGDVVTAQQCGARGDGATSDRDALQRCVTVAASLGSHGTCVLGPGTFAIDSDRDRALLIPNGVTLRGAGLGKTIVQVTGTRELDQVLTFDNPSNDWVDDLTVRGNAVDSCAGCGGLIAFVGTKAAGAPMTNFGLKNVGVENDRHDYWIYVFNGSNEPMRQITIAGLRARSYPGNCRNLTSIGVPCDIISFQGQYYQRGGTVDGITIAAPHADGTYVKRFVDFWQGVSHATLSGATLRSFGAHAGEDAGAYTVIAYFKDPLKIGAAHPASIAITDNTIIDPYTNGVYLASASDVHVNRNHISGQSDPVDATIPHGAISFNGTNGEATANVLSDNLYGIEAYPNTASGGAMVISGNRIASDKAHGKGIAVLGQATPADITITGNTIEESGQASFGVILNGSAAEPLGNVRIEGGSISASYANIYLFDSAGGAPAARSVAVDGVSFGGSPTNAAFVAANCSDIPITIRNSVFDGARFNGGDGLNLSGCRNATLDQITFRNMTSGSAHMLRLDGDRASVGNIRYQNVAPQNR